MELKIKESERIKLTAARKKVIKEYIELQTKYQNLYNQCLVNKFYLYKHQEELDIDAITEKQQNLLDKIVTDEQREEALKDMPKHIVAYEQYLIAPFYIGYAVEKIDYCLDELETEIIELVNERTKQEVEFYKDFITKK